LRAFLIADESAKCCRQSATLHCRSRQRHACE
jgi:hypothetical protein